MTPDVPHDTSRLPHLFPFPSIPLTDLPSLGTIQKFLFFLNRSTSFYSFNKVRLTYRPRFQIFPYSFGLRKPIKGNQDTLTLYSNYTLIVPHPDCV